MSAIRIKQMWGYTHTDNTGDIPVQETQAFLLDMDGNLWTTRDPNPDTDSRNWRRCALPERPETQTAWPTPKT